MTGEITWPKAREYFSRAMLLRCPVCGTKPIFPPLARTRNLHDWFTPLDGCPRCGYAYDREPGYFLLSVWAINYGIAALLGLALYLVFEWFYDWPVWTLIAAVVVPVVLFNILFARHSKSIFIAWDHLFDPHEREGGEDGGRTGTGASCCGTFPPS
ncbi:MAG: DUF983 domain-containing protein, partial [Chthoniobacterales bacterium]